MINAPTAVSSSSRARSNAKSSFPRQTNAPILSHASRLRASAFAAFESFESFPFLFTTFDAVVTHIRTFPHASLAFAASTSPPYALSTLLNAIRRNNGFVVARCARAAPAASVGAASPPAFVARAISRVRSYVSLTNLPSNASSAHASAATSIASTNHRNARSPPSARFPSGCVPRVSLARRSIASDRARASGSDGDDGDGDDGTAARTSPRRVRARDDVDAR